ncbi:MAG: FAD-dependent oxidoreductase, partial [Alphaproteobacteria bacterium]|nr:FAD-dependent oxidoreductase [Alphaproteobacteria bacterium]
MTAQIDVVILGGGIAGLWLLDILQRTGIEALVLNKAALGQGQTIASQGIIHGGTKYTFGMGLETAVSDLAHMPDCWRASLSGRQGPDLTQVPPLAETMGMWVPPQPGGKLLSAFSKKIMRSRMREVHPKKRPMILPTDDTGTFFKLDEMVIDVPRVLDSLRERHKDRIRQIP